MQENCYFDILTENLTSFWNGCSSCRTAASVARARTLRKKVLLKKWRLTVALVVYSFKYFKYFFYSKHKLCSQLSAEVSNAIRNGDPDDEPGRPPSLWRVMRASLPFQLAIVAIFCVACLLEPHCCDRVNNFNWSLSPQLKYLRGPPPVWMLLYKKKHDNYRSIFNWSIDCTIMCEFFCCKICTVAGRDVYKVSPGSIVFYDCKRVQRYSINRYWSEIDDFVNLAYRSAIF